LSQNPENTSIPLVCAMDGGLIKTSFNSERIINNARQMLDGILQSKHDIDRHKLEKRDQPNIGTALPIDEQIYDFLLEQKQQGRTLILLCQDVDNVTMMLGDRNIFDQIIHENDKSALELNSGSDYDYLGGTSTPIATWKAANNRFLVDKSPKSAERLADQGLPVANQFFRPGPDIKSVYKSIRAYQWLKNLLVFVPLITSQQFTNSNALISSFIMFFCFSMVASFGYIVNDILDLQSDRAHPTKRNRPFANGSLSITQGVLIGNILLCLAAIGCYFLPLNASIALITYLVLTIGYSLYLKSKLMIDIVALGGLFTLRVIGGGAAIQTELSFYLLCFSIFIFSSLGLVKRYAELGNLQSRNKQTAIGRSYRVEDMLPVLIIGITLGNLSVFVMGLYIDSPLVNQFYSNPRLIWFLMPLLTYWLGRLWIITHRGAMNEDPLVFAMKDKTSLLIMVTAAAILYLAA